MLSIIVSPLRADQCQAPLLVIMIDIIIFTSIIINADKISIAIMNIIIFISIVTITVIIIILPSFFLDFHET